jgi:gliding motility-associated-like protein
VYFAGDTYTPGSALSLNGYQASLTGTENVFLAKFDPSGNRICATYYGQVHDEWGSVALDNSGNVYLAGFTPSVSGMASGGFQNSYGGGSSDAFFVKLTSCTTVLSVNATTTNVLCNGQCTGTATATAANGTPPYSYSWSNGQTTSSLTGLCAGSYTATVTDAVPATVISVVTITQPAILTSTLSSTNPGCSGGNGNATVSAGGGTPLYTYLWSPGGASTSAVTGLAPGNYSATVTDANGCTQTQTLTITSINSLTVSVTSSQAACSSINGTATVTVSGGTAPFTYAWNNGQSSQTATGLAAGNYTCTITDANGCTQTGTMSITNPNSPVVTIASQTSVSCFGGNNGTATATATGGNAPYTYSWSNGNTSSAAAALSSSSYTVTVSDANGCSSTQSVSINQPAALNTTITNTSATCNSSDGTATATANGGTGSYTYLWNNGQTTQTATGLFAGNYSVTITDANGCAQVSSTTIINSNGPTATATGSATIQEGDSTSLNASGGVSYSWAPSAGLSNSSIANPVAAPTTSTAYCVFVFDANGCYDSSCVIVIVIPEPVVCGEFYIPNAFSPNDDNENDVFQAFINPVCVKEFRLVVYNRWGEKVFETYDVKEPWNGKYRGEESNPAVYAFYCTALLTNGKEIDKKGNVSLIK